MSKRICRTSSSEDLDVGKGALDMLDTCVKWGFERPLTDDMSRGRCNRAAIERLRCMWRAGWTFARVLLLASGC